MNKDNKKIITIVICLIFFAIGILVGYFICKKTIPLNEKEPDKEDKSNSEEKVNITNQILGDWGMCLDEWDCYGINITKNDNEEYFYEPYIMWSESAGAGKVINTEKVNDHKYILTIHYDAYEDFEVSSKEQTVEYVIDISKLSENILISSSKEYHKITKDRETAFDEIMNKK